MTLTIFLCFKKNSPCKAEIHSRLQYVMI